MNTLNAIGVIISKDLKLKDRLQVNGLGRRSIKDKFISRNMQYDRNKQLSGLLSLSFKIRYATLT